MTTPVELAVEAAAPVVAAGGIVLVLGAFGRRRLVHRPGPTRSPAGGGAHGRHIALARAAVAVGAAFVLTAVIGWLVIAAVVTAAGLRRLRPIVDEGRRRRDAQRQLPDAIERIVLMVHAGLSPHLAVRDACRSSPPAVRPAFELVAHRLDRGVPLGEALGALTDVLGPRAAPVADAFAAADRYGVPLEPLLDQLARDARAERRRLDEASARRLPVQLAFPLVVCTLPSFVLVAIAPAVLAALSSLGATAP